MATRKDDISSKRKRNRKARTEVSSSSDSSSESESDLSSSSSDPSEENEESQLSKKNKKDTPRTQNPTSESETAKDPHPAGREEQAFSEFYLKQATKEFANDLHKLRSAADFHGERSVPLLVEGLKQGTACFDVQERRRVGEVGVKAGGG